MFDLILGAVAVFVATNLDDFVLLTLLFATPGAPRRTVVVGQYLGLAIQVAISPIAAVGLLVVPTRRVGLLGVIPVALGIRALPRRHDLTPKVARVNLLGVVGLVVADGTDNVAVYTPVFRHLGPAHSVGYTLCAAPRASSFHSWSRAFSWSARTCTRSLLRRSGRANQSAVRLLQIQHR